MGRSASRLSSTRSGVVSARLLLCLATGLPFAAPIPPYALLRRQVRIARLRHGGTENVQHADVLMLARHATQPLVHALRLAAGQAIHGPDSQQLEIPQYRRPNRDQILQPALTDRHENSS